MFTGIVEAKGFLKNQQQLSGGTRLTIQSNGLDFSDVKIGDSIAVNGACLTVVELDSDTFSADVSIESLSKTTIGNWLVGDLLNLEKALRASDRLGGHMVSGHVDGVGEIVSREASGSAYEFKISVPRQLTRYIAKKGSVTINGISLTVNAVANDTFSLMIIPHTLEVTTLDTAEVGDQVNVEVDLIARYLERLVQGDYSDEESVNEKDEMYKMLLANSGFEGGTLS